MAAMVDPARKSDEIHHEEEEEESHERHFVSGISVHKELEQKVQPSISTDDKMRALRLGVVGSLEPFETPFGTQQLIYADWIASGRAYAPIEKFINDSVLPMYANTHTSTSVTGLQSTCFRNEARQVIQQAVNGNTKTDVVLFTGTGATGAINKLVHVLGLKTNSNYGHIRPVVFVGPFEHHSNLLPWRESCADVVNVRENANKTGICKEHLVTLLDQYKERPLLIGSFSAASNVTGVMEDTDAISAILHRRGALALWDYAAAGPYVNIDMNPVLSGDHPDRAFVHKDAVFLSPHKMLGGPNSPGVLVAKKRLFGNKVPADLSVGGGTVYFVKEDSHRYVSNRVEREEGGTPDCIGAVRAGLAFQLKQSVGCDAIEAREESLLCKIRKQLGLHPKIALLGPEIKEDGSVPHELRQLPIASFLIRHGTGGQFLHYNFVCALLNDLYGIQTRGGCMCAGPYAQRLLGIEPKVIDALENELVRDPKHCEYLRPGFSRLSLSYFVSDTEVDFILQAVRDVAEHGWKLLPIYRFNPRTGEWKHRSRFTKFPGRLWLENAPLFSSPENANREPCEKWNPEKVLAKARETMNDTKKSLKDRLSDQTQLFSESAASLQWFIMPSEAQAELQGEEKSSSQHFPPKSGREIDGAIDHDKSSRLKPVFDPRAYWKGLKSELISHAGSHPASGLNGQPLKEGEGKRDHVRDDDISGSNNASSRNLSRQVSSDATAELDTALPAAKRAKTEEVVCADDSCFRVRKKDKFPVRNAEVIRQESDSSGTINNDQDTMRSQAEMPTTSSENQLVDFSEMNRAKLFVKPSKNIRRAVGKAMSEWDMIQDGDRLLLGLSGGKDSLCLLQILLDLQKRAPVKFELACCTIDPMTESFDPSPLIPYLEALGVKYHYIKDPIFEKAKSGSLQGTSICSFCARMKRGALYTCARTHGYNVLVLAQHLDDFAESALMGFFHNGQLRSMMANYSEKNGDVRIIRPLAYVREKDTKEFSYKAKLPVINDNCPACFEAPQERKRMKRLLAKEEAVQPALFGNLRRALVPLMDPKMLEDLKSFCEAKEQHGRDRPGKKNKQQPQKKQKKPRSSLEPRMRQDAPPQQQPQ